MFIRKKLSEAEVSKAVGRSESLGSSEAEVREAAGNNEKKISEAGMWTVVNEVSRDTNGQQ